MASRTIENDRDRKMTIMTTTFIPCGAKLPIIALIAGAPVSYTHLSFIMFYEYNLLPPYLRFGGSIGLINENIKERGV